MDTKISILFYGCKARTTQDNLLPIYLRVTINGQRFEISTQRYLEAYKWSFPAGKAKGNTEEVRSKEGSDRSGLTPPKPFQPPT
jgi:hypothetical protein